MISYSLNHGSDGKITSISIQTDGATVTITEDKIHTRLSYGPPVISFPMTYQGPTTYYDVPIPKPQPTEQPETRRK